MVITSLENENVKKWKKLQKRKYRDEYGQYIVEGLHLVREAFARGALVEVILEEHEEVIFPCPYTYVTREIIEKISTLDNPVNIMGLCRKLDRDEVIGDRILILDEVQDPGNLGTIIRSAVAFNIDTIVCSMDTVDVYNPKVVRSSQGMMFHIPIMVKEVSSFINELKKDGYKIVGTKVTNGHDVRESSIYSHFALVIGNEGQGMSSDIENLCDEFLYIKMNGNCESLNASVAASILMYEINKK